MLYRANQPVFTTRVVVGETDKQTPEVQASIGALLFNPPWNVPRSIAAKEIYSKLGEDPSYLARHHMIVRHGGLIQQLPPSALGQLKFEMPNRFDVYLHDTPMKALFSQDNRRRSHGCVRVQNPRELGALLLQQPIEVINRRIALGYTNSQHLAARAAREEDAARDARLGDLLAEPSFRVVGIAPLAAKFGQPTSHHQNLHHGFCVFAFLDAMASLGGIWGISHCSHLIC